jgi:hypothetical protein
MKFWASQLLMTIATILGWFLLIPFCIGKAWSVNARSIKDGRPIDTWKYSWLNYIYGNPEDGVSGGCAVVWTSGSPGPYRPGLSTWPGLRAYLWSAVRNSCDNLKYVFSIPGDGPIVHWWKFKFGYQRENGYNVPVVGLK